MIWRGEAWVQVPKGPLGSQGASGCACGRPGGEDHSVGTLLDLRSKEKHNQMPVFQEHAVKETHP